MSLISNVLIDFWNRYITKYVSKNDVWDAKRVVYTLFRCIKCNSSNHYEIEIPRENEVNRNTEIKTSRYYLYNQLISALEAFRKNIDWRTVTEKEFLNCMVDEKFSEDKKNKVIDLLGNLSSINQRKLSKETVFDYWGRVDMIKMLVEFVSKANEFNQVAWGNYYSFSPAGSIICEYTSKTSSVFITKSIEDAISIIGLLLGDAYDEPIPTSFLIRSKKYPIISEKKLNELVYEENYS